MFAAFFMVRILLRALIMKNTISFLDLLPSTLMISFQYLFMVVNVYSANSVTAEANAMSPVIGKLMSESSKDDYFELKKFLSQIQTRNLNIQNIFFKINWNLLVVVSYFKENEISKVKYVFSGNFNCGHILNNHLSV